MKARRRSSLVETARFLLFVFLFAVVLRSFIVAPFVFPSGSMLPRLMIGDFLFVTKFPYGYSRFAMPFGLGSFDGRIAGRLPDRGDVAVFRSPAGGPDDYVIGRAAIVFFSTDGSASWWKPWTWVSAARWDRVGRTF